MDWKYLFTSYEGRISRQPFWIGMAILFAINIVVSVIVGGLPQLIIALGMMYLSFAVLVKRCHDRGKSGWWSLIALIPLVGLIWVIIDLGILEGIAGPNEYGPDPLA